MKKYFMKETGEEIQFGDIISLDLTDTKGKITTHKHVECKFHPMLVDSLIEQNIIEEKDCKEEHVAIKFDVEELKKHTMKNKIETKFEELEDRITELEGIIAELKEKIDE